jgi:adenylosuccinate synthase
MSIEQDKRFSLIIVGIQFGDEGKGKIVDFLAEHADAAIRAQGGNNAGHTVIYNDQEYKLYLIPSGILHSNCQCYIGGGVVIDPNLATEKILMLGVSKGADRQTLHANLQTQCSIVSRRIKEEGEENDLLGRLAVDPEIPFWIRG